MFGRRTALTPSLLKSFSRSFSQSSPVFGKALRFSKLGREDEVVQLVDYNAEPKKSSQVAIKMLAAPMNYRDIWNIRGTFGTQPSQFPAIGGSEGLGIVADPGSSSFKRGDWVVPIKPNFGTWRTEAVCEESDLLKIRNDIPEEFASLLTISPCTAVRLVEDFVTLEQDDVIVISGGSSLVAQTVIQLAKKKGVKVICIVRERIQDHYENLVERMKTAGAYVVAPSSFANSFRFYDLLRDLPQPKLALDCVGGKTATNLIRLLGKGGTYVTFGNASLDLTYIPTSALVYNDIQIRSFDFQQWVANRSREELQTNLNQLADMVQQNDLQFWLECYSLEEYKDALTRISQQRERKVVLRLQDQLSSYA